MPLLHGSDRVPKGTQGVSGTIQLRQQREMSKEVYRMYWKERGNPDNAGEANPVGKEDTAHRICSIHDQLYPKFEHYFQRENQ